MNKETISQDIVDLNQDVLRHCIEVDIRPSIEPNLIRLGYPYSFKDSHSFVVTVAPGCMLKGRLDERRDWADRQYINAYIQLATEIDYDQTQVRCETLQVPLGEWGPFMTRVELLISGIQKLRRKYDEFAKRKMQSLILDSLVEPYIREIGLDTATLEVSTQGDFVLKMPIFNNAHLRTNLTFDNYKKYCDGFASIAQSLQVITKPGIRRGIELERACYRDNTKSKNSGSWQVDDVKMTYLDELSEYDDFSQDKKRISASVYNCLSDLGYIFYVENDNLHIVLNKNISLIRSLSTKYTYYQYKKKSGQKIKVTDKSLALLLRMTAAASLKTGYDFNVKSFCKYYNKDNPFYNNLCFCLERLLPYNTEWNNVKTENQSYYIYKNGIDTRYCHNGGIFHILLAPDYYIKIRPMAGNIVDVVWAVMENWDEILKIPDILRDYPDFSLHIEDICEDFELQPKND